MRCDEILDDEQEVFGLHQGDVLEILDEVLPEDLEVVDDSGVLFPPYFFDDIGPVPVGELKLDKFLPNLSYRGSTLSNSAKYYSFSLSSMLSHLPESLPPCSFLI